MKQSSAKGSVQSEKEIVQEEIMIQNSVSKPSMTTPDEHPKEMFSKQASPSTKQRYNED